MRVSLDIPITTGEIAEVIRSERKSNDPERLIRCVCTDTRECREGDLFIALDGINQSGELFVNEALRKKCTVICRSSKHNTLPVKNTTTAMIDIAKYYKDKLKVPHTVAVTGSVGKSTTVKLLSKLLSEEFDIISPVKNHNNHIGVPLTALSLKKSTQVLVAELGMNHKNEISALSKCISPNIAIITKIGTSHIGNLGSREEIAEAKLEILDGMVNGTLLVPHSEPLLQGQNRAFSVGRESSLSDFSLNKAKNSRYDFRSPYGTIKDISFFDEREYLLDDLSFALSAALMLGVSEEKIKSAANKINESDIRQRLIKLRDYTIFDDSYNASLESITADFKYMSSLNCPKGAFLGDVLELGDRSESIHEQIGKNAAASRIDRLYLCGKYAYAIANGAIKNGFITNDIFVNPDPTDIRASINHIKENHEEGELILFKASHKYRFDIIADTIATEER